MHSIKLVNEDDMITAKSRRDWQRWMSRLEVASGQSNQEVSADLDPVKELKRRQDTVGAVAIDTNGNLAAGVSR
jgi:isoaspartyl peptidase/L-asparaginase-like protein (Ntn-hydrolase superfamily)